MPALIIIGVVLAVAALAALIYWVIFPLTVIGSGVAVAAGAIVGVFASASVLFRTTPADGAWGVVPAVVTPDDVRDGRGFTPRDTRAAGKPNDWAWPSYVVYQYLADNKAITEVATLLAMRSFAIFAKPWKNWGWWRLTLIPCYIITGVWSTTVWTVTIIFIICGAPVWVLAQLVRYAARGVQWVMDAVRIRRTGALAQCAQPGCYYATTSPSFTCPNPKCRSIHRDLGDIRLGVLSRRCGCSTSMTIMPGAAGHDPAYKALCPRCESPLETGAGENRGLLVAVVGDTGSGKTLVVSKGLKGVVAALDRAGNNYRLESESADAYIGEGPVDHADGLPWPVVLAVDSALRPTTVLHVVDPPGPWLESAESVSDLTYLSRADGLLVVLSAAQLLGLDPSGRNTVVVDPTVSFERLLSRVRAAGVPARRQVAAIVITGLDQLVRDGRARQGDAATSASSAAWLTANGLGGIVRQSEHEFRKTRFFLVDAAGRVSVNAPRSPAAPLRWLIDSVGLHLPAVPQKAAAQAASEVNA